MEAAFARFHSYDFEGDQRFLRGVQTLQAGEQAKILDAKLFFYNRFVEPVDSTSYKAWRSSGSGGDAEGPGTEKTEEPQVLP
ncbi:uncharacterized protein LOC133514348 isoform X3 [Syngnathoides biaculeatus]|uniref:uncharacterized protein LOC133514348 isoform X3 n=1 Tax=Syngnathoides biaculeatus TaxID=300417 RepID=UPI002ADE3CBC|nr:uncharacterized protein LOC133514348 isoform X3 [Syngnathoides biaculeatus]